MLESLTAGELEMTWKGDAESCPNIYLEGIWRTAISISQGIQYMERNSKREYPEHKSVMLASKLTTSVIPGSISTATIDERMI
jgi:hypothetical protein